MLLKNRWKSCCLLCRREFTGDHCPRCGRDESPFVAAPLPTRPTGPTLYADVGVQFDLAHPIAFDAASGQVVDSDTAASEILRRFAR